MSGPDPRYYIQYRPDPSALGDLVRLQTALSRAGGVLAREPELHVTVIHIGSLRRLHADLSRQGSTIGLSSLREGLDGYAAWAEAAMLPNVSLRPSGLELWGPKRGVVVLRFAKDASSLSLHRQAAERLMALAGNWIPGRRPEELFGSLPQLRHAMSFRLHMTLARYDGQDRAVPDGAEAMLPADVSLVADTVIQWDRRQ